MIPSIYQTRFFIFIIVFVHSFPLFALAAPIPNTPETSSALRKREPQQDGSLYAMTERDVHSRDNKVSDIRVPAPTDSYLSGRSPMNSRITSASKVAAERESQTLARRNWFSNAFKKIGGAISGVARGVVNGVKKVAHTVKKGFNSVWNTVKSAGSWVKTVGSVASGVASFIPGASGVAGAANSAMGAMDKIQGPMNVANSFLKRV